MKKPTAIKTRTLLLGGFILCALIAALTAYLGNHALYNVQGNVELAMDHIRDITARQADLNHRVTALRNLVADIKNAGSLKELKALEETTEQVRRGWSDQEAQEILDVVEFDLADNCWHKIQAEEGLERLLVSINYILDGLKETCRKLADKLMDTNRITAVISLRGDVFQIEGLINKALLNVQAESFKKDYSTLKQVIAQTLIRVSELPENQTTMKITASLEHLSAMLGSMADRKIKALKVRRRLSKLLLEGGVSGPQEVLTDAAGENIIPLPRRLHRLEEKMVQRAMEMKNQVEATFALSREDTLSWQRTLAVLSFGAVLLALIIGYLASRSVVGGVDRTVKALRRMADFDFTRRPADKPGIIEEVAQMEEALKITAEALGGCDRQAQNLNFDPDRISRSTDRDLQ